MTTDQILYRVLQNYTNGWDVVAEKVTKEQCDQILSNLLAEGVNPQHIKVLIDS